MNSFQKSQTTEAEGLVKMRPFIEETSNGRYVTTNKGPLAPFLQDTVGDVILNKGDVVYGLELKTEKKHTGNLFIEFWSNLNADNNSEFSRAGCKPGWALTSQCDYLYYYFLDKDWLYIINWFKLRRWAFWYPGVVGKPNIFQYDLRRVGGTYENRKKGDQPNDTHGFCVPIIDLFQNLNPDGEGAGIKRVDLERFR